MSFLWTQMLYALVLIPVFVFIYILLQRRRKKYALRYASLSLVKEAMGRGPGIRRHIPPILFLIALTAMTVALARPQASVTLPSMQGTVILTFDVSGSMRAEDMKPNRLEAAKAAARTFVEKQPANVRIGVVSFSDSASVVQAPTTDREAIASAINRLVYQRRTAIGSGILISLDMIFEEPGSNKPAAPTSPRDPLVSSQATPAPKSNPMPPGKYAPAIVVLLSDGVSNTGPMPLEAAQKALDLGVRVYTVGVGSVEGATLRMEGFAMRVRLDEETLKRVAEKTDGEYYRAESEADLTNIYGYLSSNLVFKAEQTEITAFFTAFAAVFLVVAGVLSMLWFNRLP